MLFLSILVFWNNSYWGPAFVRQGAFIRDRRLVQFQQRRGEFFWKWASFRSFTVNGRRLRRFLRRSKTTQAGNASN